MSSFPGSLAQVSTAARRARSTAAAVDQRLQAWCTTGVDRLGGGSRCAGRVHVRQDHLGIVGGHGAGNDRRQFAAGQFLHALVRQPSHCQAAWGSRSAHCWVIFVTHSDFSSSVRPSAWARSMASAGLGLADLRQGLQDVLDRARQFRPRASAAIPAWSASGGKGFRAAGVACSGRSRSAPAGDAAPRPRAGMADGSPNRPRRMKKRPPRGECEHRRTDNGQPGKGGSLRRREQHNGNAGAALIGRRSSAPRRRQRRLHQEGAQMEGGRGRAR